MALQMMTSISSLMMTVLAPVKLMSWSRVTLVTASPEMAAWRAGVTWGVGSSFLWPLLALPVDGDGVEK